MKIKKKNSIFCAIVLLGMLFSPNFAFGMKKKVSYAAMHATAQAAGHYLVYKNCVDSLNPGCLAGLGITLASAIAQNYKAQKKLWNSPKQTENYNKFRVYEILTVAKIWNPLISLGVAYALACNNADEKDENKVAGLLSLMPVVLGFFFSELVNHFVLDDSNEPVENEDDPNVREFTFKNNVLVEQKSKKFSDI